MDFNNKKLTKILKEKLTEDFDVRVVKSYENNKFFSKIFADYNKDQPKCNKLENNVKNRKMILRKVS